MNLSIVPAYNEEVSVIKLLELVKEYRVKSHNVAFEVIVIDDGSTDKTAQLIEDNAHLYDVFIKLSTNSGKGRRFAPVEKATGDYVLFQDADLDFHPR